MAAEMAEPWEKLPAEQEHEDDDEEDQDEGEEKENEEEEEEEWSGGGKSNAEHARLKDLGFLDVLGTRQLYTKTIKAPIGDEDELKPKRGDLASISLVGWVEGTEEEVEVEAEKEIWVGYYDVAQGLDMVVQLMRVGEEVEVILGPRFGFGETGLYKGLGPNAWLHYKLELHSMRTAPDLSLLSFAEVGEILSARKDRGNILYALGEVELALQLYAKVESLAEEALAGTKLSETERRQLSAHTATTASNNAAAAALKLGDYEKAVAAADRCLAEDPSNEKAMFRKVRALEALRREKEAVALLETPAAKSSALLRGEAKRMEWHLSQESRAQRRLYQRMVSGAGESGGAAAAKKKKRSRRVTRIFAALAAAVAAIAAILALALPRLSQPETNLT